MQSINIIIANATMKNMIMNLKNIKIINVEFVIKYRLSSFYICFNKLLLFLKNSNLNI